MSHRPTANGARNQGEDEPVIAGPYSLVDGSFILEFLQPKASRNASVLMRATYKHDHPMCKKGKEHAHSPPLHLHFQQSESFTVLSGEVGTTTAYTLVDQIHTPQNTSSTPYHIPTWMPHRFWPSPNAKEDTTFLVWAHPNPVGMDDKMDRLFFSALLMYVSDVAEGKAAGLSLLQIMLMQHFSATALIMFPRFWILGPLRWWVPWIFQCLCAYIAMLMGYKPLLKKYMTQEDWEDEKVQERVGMWRKDL